MDKTIKNLIVVACVFFVLMVVFLFFLVNSSLNDNSSNFNEEVLCSSDVYNCEDFSNCEEAREVFDTCMNFTNSDVHGLDLDSDSIPCNSLC